MVVWEVIKWGTWEEGRMIVEDGGEKWRIWNEVEDDSLGRGCRMM